MGLALPSSPALLVLHLLFMVPALLIGLVLHEFAHALVAVRRGDPTPKNQGRLTLDPRRHLEPLGTLMVLLVGVGFAKPVQVNQARLRSTVDRVVVALAGPFMNLVVAAAVSVPMKLLEVTDTFGLRHFVAPCGSTVDPLLLLQVELFYIYTLNLFLFVFNLLPIPPLDGFELVRAVLRKSNPRLLFQVESNRQAIILVAILIFFFVPGVLGTLMNFVVGPVAGLLGPPLSFPCR